MLGLGYNHPVLLPTTKSCDTLASSMLRRHFQTVINVLANGNTIVLSRTALVESEQSTEVTSPSHIHGLVLFGVRQDLVSAHEPLRSARTITSCISVQYF